MKRSILHCDMNNFFASVELLEHPELKNTPVAVSGDTSQRHGIILAKNDLAKKAGVITAETVSSALSKCPKLKFLEPHYEKYSYYSQLINDIYLEYTDLVEPFSIDESWLDVTDSTNLFGAPEKIANEIRQRVKSEFGLTLSAGVSYNKIFAKMGSEYKKPDAITVITESNFREMLWPLPIEKFFYVGKATASKLRNININTIGDIAHADSELLEKILGMHGLNLVRFAKGLDNTPVSSFYNNKDKVKSISSGMTFKRDLLGYHDISLAVTDLSDKVSTKMRKQNIKAGGIRIEVTGSDFKKISKQISFRSNTNSSITLKKEIISLITKLDYMNTPIRLLTVTAINLTNSNKCEQLTFFSSSQGIHSTEMNKSLRDEKFDNVIDDIREKFGKESLQFAHVLKNDIGISAKKRV